MLQTINSNGSSPKKAAAKIKTTTPLPNSESPPAVFELWKAEFLENTTLLN